MFKTIKWTILEIKTTKWTVLINNCKINYLKKDKMDLKHKIYSILIAVIVTINLVKII